MSAKAKMVGVRFGRLVVVKELGAMPSDTQWLCQCDCGKETAVGGKVLRRSINPTRSCGCLKSDLMRQRYAAGQENNTYFWGKVQKQTGSCWLWTGGCDTGGYGQIGNGKGKLIKAHRMSWEIHNGPIPRGQFVLHQCDVRRCVNPDHLFLGTQVDNMADMKQKGRRKGINGGADNGRAVLTKSQVDQIRARYAAGGVSQTVLAKEFGVWQTTISMIVRGRQWCNTD